LVESTYLFNFEGADGPANTYYNQDGTPTLLFSVSLNGVTVIYDFSTPNVIGIYSAGGSVIIDSQGIQTYTSDCSSELFFAISDVLATIQTPLKTVRKREIALSKRDQTNYVTTEVPLAMFDSCHNPVADLVDPQIQLQQVTVSDPPCSFAGQNGNGYGWYCSYYEANGICKYRAQGILVGTTANPAQI
jgi:hypothetical protein